LLWQKAKPVNIFVIKKDFDLEKVPFEKVRSLVERRKILESLIKAKTQVICKGADDSLFYFNPTSIIGDSALIGSSKAITGLPTKNVEVIGNFTVEPDRYFFRCPVKIQGDLLQFPLNMVIFRLQRRASLRVKVPHNFPLAINIYQINGNSKVVTTKVIDLSAGGVRFKITDPKDLKLNLEDKLSIAVHPSSGRALELGAVVRHALQMQVGINKEIHYGCEFVTSSTVTKNRLLALSLELQQKIIKGLER
jgi:alginate biosynthesis protein Alg44